MALVPPTEALADEPAVFGVALGVKVVDGVLEHPGGGDAIVKALHECAGNRVHADPSLGMSQLALPETENLCKHRQEFHPGCVLGGFGRPERR
jgi:hypothetical protein